MKLARNVSFAISLLGTVLCLYGVAHSAPAQGEDANRKVVRIAYQESNRLMMVDANHKPVSGYVFDYIQTIGIYSGWRVQYIPCNSFSECVTKLLSGAEFWRVLHQLGKSLRLQQVIHHRAQVVAVQTARKAYAHTVQRVPDRVGAPLSSFRSL